MKQFISFHIMRNPIIVTFLLLSLTSSSFANIAPAHLTCEYLKDPMVIDIPNPRLSWINTNPEFGRNQYKSAWQIRVSSSREALLKVFADTSMLSNNYDGMKDYIRNIFALIMGVPDDQKDRVVASFKADIIANEGHLDTGIFGTQFFFEVLSENGLHEMAYEAMNKRTAPGYWWWIEQGATTSWEGWKNPGSGNHPMFGGGIVWFYRKLAGMNADPEHPVYRNIIFCPEPVSEISSAFY